MYKIVKMSYNLSVLRDNYLFSIILQIITAIDI
jgi:hypothetical protein